MKLRHLSNGNLDKLERELEILGSQVPLQIISVSHVGSTWFVHYCVVLDPPKKKVKIETAKPTETINPKAG